MNQMPFKDYEGFKELFVREVPNKGRELKNKALLAYLGASELRSYIKEKAKDNPLVGKLLDIRDMAELFDTWDDIIMNCSVREQPHPLSIMGRLYGSDKYKTDGRDGICLDGDIRAYRYVNVERDRIFKMKIGKLYKSIILGTEVGRLLPEPVVLYMCEEMTRQWEAYAVERVPNEHYELHVDDDFKAIYNGTSRCKGNFNSCMSGGSHSNFYRDSVKAKAAYLTDSEGLIVARCIIFTEVRDEDTGETYRLAERQYATDGDELLMRLLIQKLIDGNHIDGYKKPGASCSDSRLFVSNAGESWSDKHLSIECTLDPREDVVSYQDSFKYLDTDEERAYNRSSHYYDYDLSTTALHLDAYDEDEDEDEGIWDEYHDEYIHGATETAWYNGEEIQVDSDRLGNFVWCERDDMYCFEDEATYTEDEDYVITDENTLFYSDILERYYYFESNRDIAEEEYIKEHPYHAEWDDSWHSDANDVKMIYTRFDDSARWGSISWIRLDRLVRHGAAVMLGEDTAIMLDYMDAFLAEYGGDGLENLAIAFA